MNENEKSMTWASMQHECAFLDKMMREIFKLNENNNQHINQYTTGKKSNKVFTSTFYGKIKSPESFERSLHFTALRGERE